MRELFTEKNRYSEDAARLDYEALQVLKPLFQVYKELGFNPRDISHVIHLSITDLELEFILKDDS